MHARTAVLGRGPHICVTGKAEDGTKSSHCGCEKATDKADFGAKAGFRNRVRIISGRLRREYEAGLSVCVHEVFLGRVGSKFLASVTFLL